MMINMNPLMNQRGTALILALTMLVVMSLVGLLALSTSDTELRISGNFLTSRAAFYAADRAVAYAGANADIFTSTGTVNLFTDGAHLANIQIGNSGLDNDPARSSTATFLTTGPPPVSAKTGEGSDAGVFEARYFLVEVNGVAPVGSLNPSRATLEAQVARIIPK